jgi:hypothetical protein
MEVNGHVSVKLSTKHGTHFTKADPDAQGSRHTHVHIHGEGAIFLFFSAQGLRTYFSFCIQFA